MSRRCALLLPLATLAAPRDAAAQAAGAMPAGVAEAATRLGDQLLARALSGTATGNALLSPWSLHAALGLLALGARDRTASEFQALLGARGGTEALAYALRNARLGVQRASGAGARIRLAQAAWTRLDRHFLDTWQNLAQVAANAPGRRVSFDGSGERLINAWAARQTAGAIPEIVPDLPSQTELVLTTAIAFAGSWASAFDAAATAPAPFRRADRAEVEAPMMRAELDLAHGAQGAGEAIRLDYAGGRCALWLGTAASAEAVPDFLREVAARGPAAWLRGVALAPRRMAVRLPRLALAAGGDMLPGLAGSEFGQVLGPRGNLRGVTGRPVQVSAVLHRARLVLDEAGTVAAAATAVVATRSMPPAMPEFSADRPFVLMLGSRSAAMPLFVGYVGDASNAAG